MPIAGLLGILPRFTAWVNIDEIAVIIVVGKCWPFVGHAAVAHVVEVGLRDAVERAVEFRLKPGQRGFRILCLGAVS